MAVMAPLVLAALCWQGVAMRHAAQAARDLGQEFYDRMDGNGVVVLPNGTAMNFLTGLKIEGVLSSKAFTCVRGTIVAVRLPNFAPRAGTFYCYLDGMGKINARGVEIYRESRDATSELILFPPVNGSTYKLLHNSATGPGDVRTRFQQRLFETDFRKHPCEVGYEEPASKGAAVAAAAPAAEDDAVMDRLADAMWGLVTTATDADSDDEPDPPEHTTSLTTSAAPVEAAPAARPGILERLAEAIWDLVSSATEATSQD